MKYLIKKTYTATENNPNFAGQTKVWYHGPKGLLDKELSSYAKNNGYKTKAGLVKALVSEQKWSKLDEENGFWKISLEVVEV